MTTAVTMDGTILTRLATTRMKVTANPLHSVWSPVTLMVL